MTRIVQTLSASLMLALVSTCASAPAGLEVEKPKASLNKVELTSLSFVDMDLDFQVALENPYPLELRVASVKADFLIDAAPFFSVESVEELSVEAKGSAMLPFQLKLAFADVIAAVQSYAQKDSIDTEIQLVVTVRLHGGTIPGVPETWDFPFTLTKTLPTIKPSVGISDFRVEGPNTAEVQAAIEAKAKSLATTTTRQVKRMVTPERVASVIDSLLRGEQQPREVIEEVVEEVLPDITIRDLDLKFAIEFTLNLDNQTPTALLFENLDFQFVMNEEPLITGTTTEITREGNRSKARIRGEFSSRSLSDSMLTAFQTRQASFQFSGKTQVKLPDIIRVEPVTLDFTETGDFSLGTN